MTVVVIGSGLAAYAAIDALIEKGIIPLVLDVGKELEENKQILLDEMSQLDPVLWSQNQIDRLFLNPAINFQNESHPQKLYFGSKFVYENELGDNSFIKQNLPPFTYAMGGFSAVWGASAMMPNDKDIINWPINIESLYSSAKNILQKLPFSATQDALENFSPLLIQPKQSRLESSGDKYLINKLQKASLCKNLLGKIIVGHSRLLTSFDEQLVNNNCRQCGHCMSGCVYGSIFKAEQVIKNLNSKNKLVYKKNILVKKIKEIGDKVKITYIDLKDNKENTQEFSKVIVAAGVYGSTKIIANSSQYFDLPFTFKTTSSLILPVFSFKRLKNNWPNANTQPSIFIEAKNLDISKHWIHTQISTVNELFLAHFGIVHKKNYSISEKIIKLFLDHFFIAQANLSSEVGTGYIVTYKAELNDQISVAKSIREDNKISRISNYKFAKILSKFFLSANLVPLLPLYKDFSLQGGYHLGGSLPMTEKPKSYNETDIYGRPMGYKNVHIVDSSIFPSIPATTIGLLAMANARRIINHVFEEE